MKPTICTGCGCDEKHACPIPHVPLGPGCWWLRFNADARAGVCSACEDLVKGWDAGQHKPINALIAERYYRQVLFLYPDQADAITWMHTPQYLLRHNSPRELILAGELEKVQTLVDQLQSGAFA